MLWCSNYGFRGSMGYSFSIILSVSHFKPGLRYVGDITGFESAKKLLYSWDITILSAIVRIMILQHIEIM